MSITKRSAQHERDGAEQQDAVLFRALVERVDDVGIIAVDAGGFVRSWNIGAAKLTEYRRSDILGRHISVLFPVEGSDAAGPAQTYSTQPSAHRFEQRSWLVRKSGSRFWAEIIFSPLRENERDEPSGYAVFLRDRTEDHATTIAQRRLTSILEGTTDLVAFADRDGRLLYLNDAGRRLLEMGVEEDISTVRITELHPDWSAGVLLREAIPTAIEAGHWSGETAFLTRSGREVPTHQVALAHRSQWNIRFPLHDRTRYY